MRTESHEVWQFEELNGEFILWSTKGIVGSRLLQRQLGSEEFELNVFGNWHYWRHRRTVIFNECSSFAEHKFWSSGTEHWDPKLTTLWSSALHWHIPPLLFIRPHRSTAYVDAAYSYRPSSMSVGLSVTLVSPAKTAALIELPFGLRTWVGPGNHVLHGVQIPHEKGQMFGGEWASHCKV